MKRSRFSETQIVKILKEAEAGVAVSEGSTPLKYWIEGGCNTASTQVPQV